MPLPPVCVCTYIANIFSHISSLPSTLTPDKWACIGSVTVGPLNACRREEQAQSRVLVCAKGHAVCPAQAESLGGGDCGGTRTPIVSGSTARTGRGRERDAPCCGPCSGWSLLARPSRESCVPPCGMDGRVRRAAQRSAGFPAGRGHPDCLHAASAS